MPSLSGRVDIIYPPALTSGEQSRTSEVEWDASYLSCSYDSYDQFTSAIRTNGPNPAADAAYNYQYQYDEVGNRLHEDRGLLDLDGTFNPLNQLTHLGFGGKLKHWVTLIPPPCSTHSVCAGRTGRPKRSPNVPEKEVPEVSRMIHTGANFMIMEIDDQKKFAEDGGTAP